MLELLVVGLGGFLGAIARFGVTRWMARSSAGGFPFGTMLVNVVGCLLIGAVFAVVETRPHIPANLRLFIMIGILGSFTTFSTFGHETLELLKTGATGSALAYLLGSVAVGLVAVIAGRALGNMV
jgi:fluoride exporter